MLMKRIENPRRSHPGCGSDPVRAGESADLGGKSETSDSIEIAEAERGSKHRVQNVTSLAFLAPDIRDRIASGEQPVGLTTDFLIKTRFSALWSEQRNQFSAL